VTASTTRSTRPAVIDGDLSPATACDQLAEQLRSTGAVVFAGIRGPEHLLALAGGLMDVVVHPDADATGLTTITDLGPAGWRPNAAGFSPRELPPHTDRSSVAHPPAMLLTSCASTAATGGTCQLIDGLAVHDDLATTSPQALAAFLRPRTTLFGGAAGYLGSVFTDVPAADGRPQRRMIRLRLDNLARFSPEIAVWVPALQAAIERNSHTFDLAVGQGYLVDNHRWLHARQAYEGPRMLYRLHGDPLPGLGLHPGIPLEPSTAP
jgi:alpha-ketoglutarate-dependent taurine dioxygenase